MTEIYLISGFLGAGKTSLILKIAENLQQKEKICVVENEFGEISIDGAILQSENVWVKEINQGCICCSLVGDFRRGLEEIIDNYHPRRIFVEPSGVAKLSELIRSLAGLEKRGKEIELFSITVVDASKYFLYSKNFKEFYKDQIEFADVLVLSRKNQVSEKEFQNILASLKGKRVWRNFSEEVPGEALLDFVQKKDLSDCKADGIKAPEFEQWTWTNMGEVEPERMRKKILHAFEAFKLFRVKGFFVYEGKRYLLQGTPGEVRIIPMDGNQEGLVFIGNFSKEELKEYIHGKCD